MSKNAWLLAFALLGVLGFAGCGGGNNSTAAPPPPPTVSISPKQAAIAMSQTQQFNATITGDGSNSGITWSVDGAAGGSATVGTINTSGLYTPPAAGGAHTVTAASVASPTTAASATITVTDLPGVFTYHNDSARDGANTQEYALTPSNMTTSTFGKLFSCPVDGAVYAQPLWAPGINIGGGIHNVLVVATQHDSIYAFDADASPCVTYWQAHLLDALHGGTAGEQPVTWNDVGRCAGNIYPEIGVTGTPVIDSSTNTIYVVSASESNATNSGNCVETSANFYHRLHALSILTGSEESNSPVTIAAQVAGNGDGSSGGVVSFNSQVQHNRSGLALSNGTVYVAFGAHEDESPCNGWLFGYAESDLTQSPSLFNSTPDGALGGIWAAGNPPAIDSTGDLYVVTGNGVFDADSPLKPANDYGDSILRLHPSAGLTLNGSNLFVAGWFAPWNEATLSLNDKDLGASGPILLPDQTTGPIHLLVQVAKDGTVRLLDRDNMGNYNSANDDQIIQSFAGPKNGLWGNPALWQNNLYIGGGGDALRQFTFDPSTGLFAVTASSFSSQLFGYPGAILSVSSQGNSNGILWAIDAGMYGYHNAKVSGVNCAVVPVPSACSGPAILHAYNPANLAVEYWNSTMAANNRDQAGNAVKFVPPTIANGKVYVGTSSEVDVYGLLPQ